LPDEYYINSLNEVNVCFWTDWEIWHPHKKIWFYELHVVCSPFILLGCLSRKVSVENCLHRRKYKENLSSYDIFYYTSVPFLKYNMKLP
jgi:hypothetical protein